MKTCRHCGITEDLIDFFKRKERTDNVCIACKREMWAEQSRRYYLKHSDRAKACHGRWVTNNIKANRLIHNRYYRKKRNHLTGYLPM